MRGFRHTIGALTLLGTAIAAWWLLSLLSPEGAGSSYLLSLEFRQARGLKPGAFVRYRGVRVGSVRDVVVASGGDKALVSIALDEEGRDLARQSSRFWIVTPRFDGLTGGATGLDTLVRDSYVAFVTANLDSEPLPSGSLLVGRESPVLDEIAATLPPPQIGDLSMVLLASSSEGVEAGADVRHRGVAVGEVRRVGLAPDGTHVEIELRIAAAHRRSVQEDSTSFWVARPRVSGALLSGLAIEDLTAVLEPFVAYRTSRLDGAPAPDGWRCVALDRAPAETDPAVPASALDRSGDPRAGASEAAELRDIAVVEVLYDAVELDWFSANDDLSSRGHGVFYIDRSGRPVVVTARSTCDGMYFARDTFGSPEVARERIRVVFSDGSVLRAGRQWIDPLGRDLALLVLERAPGGSLDVGTATDRLVFDAVEVPQWRVLNDDGGFDSWTPPAGEISDDSRGRPLLDAGGRVVAIVGQPERGTNRPSPVRLDPLPVDLRP
jgi:hypothetical protein